MIIAIDGPAGSGKTTTAHMVAESLGIAYINTGAMYRAITLKVIKDNIDLRNILEIRTMLDNISLKFIGNKDKRLQMNGVDVTSEITKTSVSDRVSEVSANIDIRRSLVAWQREMAVGSDVVLEGRDIGTAVFPDAEFKFFLNADLKERTKRRKKELEAKGEKVSFDILINKMNNRDKIDSTRKYSPLKKAKDAIEIDTTHMSIPEQVRHIVEIVTKK